MKSALAALLLTTAAAAAQPAAQLHTVLPDDVKATRAAYQAFLQACPGLRSSAPVIDHIKLGNGTIHRRSSWETAVSVIVSLRDGLKIGYVSDIEFDIVGGDRPGFIPVTVAAGRLCFPDDMPADFYPVPGIRMPTAWPSTNATAKSTAHSRLDSTVAPLGDD